MPLGGIRTKGATRGVSVPPSRICWRFSMYCKQSRSVRMSYGLCSISNTQPSYWLALMAMAFSMLAGVKGTNTGLPSASSLMTGLRRGISATRVSF